MKRKATATGNGSVFVTVGTTDFDKLVRCVDGGALGDGAREEDGITHSTSTDSGSRVLKALLDRRGYDHVVMQIGRGNYIPRQLKPLEEDDKEGDEEQQQQKDEEDEEDEVVHQASNGKRYKRLRDQSQPHSTSTSTSPLLQLEQRSSGKRKRTRRKEASQVKQHEAPHGKAVKVTAATTAKRGYWYRFKPSLDADFERASLVISHAGAGSILEALRLNKPLIVVVNEDLMDNHQIELGDALMSRGYLLKATLNDAKASERKDDLISLLEDADTRLSRDDFEPFPEKEKGKFGSLVDELMMMDG